VSDDATRRAARLARLYPRHWRRRYPDFVGVLAAELAHHRWRATGDVVRGAVVERLRTPQGPDADPTARARGGLALVEAAVVPFAGLAIGLWSQLDTAMAARGTQEPSGLRGTDVLLGVAVAAGLALLGTTTGLALTRLRRTRRPSGPGTNPGTSPGTTWSARSLGGPAAAFMVSMAVLSVAGWAADRSGWYSPAAAALPGRGLGHLLTLWARGMVAAITPAWVHPTLFGRMPVGELVATVLAPAAALTAAGALRRLVRSLPLPPPGRLPAALSLATVGTMFVSLAAALRWLLAHPHPQGSTSLLTRTDPLAPGHTGWAVVVLLAALALVATVGTGRLLGGRPAPGEGVDHSPRPAHR